MNCKKIITGFTAGTIALANVSCKREPIHRITDVNKFPIIERVDSFVKSGLNEIDTTGLKLFKVDTVSISNKKLNNPNKLSNSIKSSAISETDFVNSSPKYYSGNVLSFSDLEKSLGLRDTSKTKNVSNDIICKMQNKVYTNKIENKFYVPIEYYKKK